MRRRLIAGILVLCMLTGALPARSLAAEEDSAPIYGEDLAGETEETEEIPVFRQEEPAAKTVPEDKVPVFRQEETAAETVPEDEAAASPPEEEETYDGFEEIYSPEEAALTALAQAEVLANGYSLPAPRITGLSVTYNGKVTELPTNGSPNGPLIKPVQNGGKPRYTVTFENPQLVGSVYIVTFSKGVELSLTAEAQMDDNFVAEGFFGGDPNYFPETIRVEYSRRAMPVSVGENDAGVSLRQIKAQLLNNGVYVRQITNGDDGVTAEIVLKETAGEVGGTFVEAAISEYVPAVGDTKDAVEKWMNLKETVDNRSEYTLENGVTLLMGKMDKFSETAQKDPVEAGVIVVRDAANNKYVKMVISACTVDKSGIKKYETFSQDLVENTFSGLSTACTTILNVYEIERDTSALKEEIENRPGLSDAERADLLEKADELDRDRKFFLGGTAILPILVGVSAMGGAPAVVFTALMGGMSVAADYFWAKRISMLQGAETRTFVYPSGHEGWRVLPRNPEGAVVTVPDHFFAAYDASFTSIGNSFDEAYVCPHGRPINVAVRNDATVYLSDCQFEQNNATGQVTGGGLVNNILVSGGSGGTVVVDQTRVRNIDSTGGDIIINGGLLANENNKLIRMNGGSITINGGWLMGAADASAASQSELIFEDGLTTTYGYSSRITINDGVLSSPKDAINVRGHRGMNVDINGGDITGNIIATATDGTTWVTVSGGTVKGNIGKQSAPKDIDRLTVTNGTVSGVLTGETVDISGGAVGGVSKNITTLTISGSAEVKGNVGEVQTLTMTGGTVGGSVEGASSKLEITGGTVEGGVTARASGEGALISGDAVVRGGVKLTGSAGATIEGYAEIYGGISGGNRLTIDGGTIYGDIGTTDSTMETVKYLTIRSGAVHGVIGNRGQQTAILSIGPGSDILLDGQGSTPFYYNLPGKVTAEAQTGYTGGVTYYDSPTSAGRYITIADLNSNITRYLAKPYVRLVADGRRTCAHQYTYTRTVAATCESGGYTLYTCSKCGAEDHRRLTDALVHVYGNFSLTAAPTSATYGLQEHVCKNCLHSESKLITTLSNGAAITPTAPKVASAELVNMTPKDITASGAFADPRITVVNLGANTTASAVAALYDRNGRMLSLSRSSVSLKSGENTCALTSPRVSDPKAVASVKVFLADGSQHPMCRAAES